jgi:hypothetical protein
MKPQIPLKIKSLIVNPKYLNINIPIKAEMPKGIITLILLLLQNEYKFEIEQLYHCR